MTVLQWCVVAWFVGGWIYVGFQFGKERGRR
jgi:hypothetical protein